MRLSRPINRVGVLLAVALAVSALASLSFPVAGQAAVADAFCASPPDTLIATGQPTERFAQTFSPINGGFLSAVRLFVDEQAHGGNYHVQITPVNPSDLSPVNPGVAMTEGTIVDSSIPISTNVFQGSEVEVDFPNPPAVLASSEYAIVVTRPGDLLGVGIKSAAFGSGKDPCPDGALYASPDASSAWEKIGEGDDMVFTTFVGGPSLTTTPPLAPTSTSAPPPSSPPPTCTVPKLSGKTLAGVVKKIRSGLCKLGKVTKKERCQRQNRPGGQTEPEAGQDRCGGDENQRDSGLDVPGPNTGSTDGAGSEDVILGRGLDIEEARGEP